MKKMILKLIYNLIVIHLPDRKITHKMKRLCLKNIVKSCGVNTSVNRGGQFSEDLIIGDNSGIGENCIVFPRTQIGNNVLMARDVIINPDNHGISKDHNINEQPITNKGVIIEDDVWIGLRAVILTGVTVHKGAVVAAGAIVTEDVPTYAVVGGIPAHVIKYRT